MQSLLKGALVSCVLIYGVSSTQVVTAVGLGEAKVQSGIGQNLKVFIPIELGSSNFDINQVSVIAATEEQRSSLGINEFGGFNSKLNYQVIGSAGRQGIVVTTNTPVNEPYVNIAFQINNAGSTIVKAVPVLLDLPGQQSTQAFSSNEVVFPYVETTEPVFVEQTYEPAPVVSSNNTYSAYETVSTQPNQGQISSEISPSYGADIMGPYDWADEGFIPQNFGPVLDGQSLWRVARRINKAMGVSVDQMMWGIYRENPQAFSGKTVDTLTSGVTLKIPQESLVRELTERQAIEALANNTGASVAQGFNDNNAESTDAENVPAETSSNIKDVVPDVVDSSNGSSEQSEDIGGMVISPIDRQLLDTLNTTVIDLQKQIIDKDREIEFLRSELEKYTGVTDLEGGTNESELPVDGGDVSVAKGEIPLEIVDETEQNDLTVEDEVVDPELTAEELISTADDEASIGLVNESPEKAGELINLDRPDFSLNQNVPETSKKQSFWYWLIGGLVALVAGLFLLRDFVSGLFKRWFINDDEVVLNIPSVVDSSRTMTSRPASYAPEVKTPSDDYVPDEVTFEEDEFLIDEGHGVDIEEINLSDRIKDFLRAGDFSAASKTVEFADETGMDVNYLDFCRLQISAAKEDKSEFAKVFNRVNRRINDYHPDIQNKITILHRQMFDSDSVIDFGFKED